MSDPVLIALITTIGATVNGIVVVWSGKRTRGKVAEVHTLVNNKSDKQESKIDALKGEVGRLNENSKSSTPESGGAVNLQHGQVIVPTKEPEVKK